MRKQKEIINSNKDKQDSGLQENIIENPILARLERVKRKIKKLKKEDHNIYPLW